MLVFRSRKNAGDHPAGFGFPGHEGFLARFERLQRGIAQVQAEAGLAFVGVLSVAVKAVFGKNGADVAVEADVPGRCVVGPKRHTGS